MQKMDWLRDIQGSSKIIGHVTIRQNTHDFLFNSEEIYGIGKLASLRYRVALFA